MKKSILVALMFIVPFASSSAQGFLQCEFGISKPAGDLATYSFENAILKGAGCATTGFNIGAKFYNPLKTKNLSMVYSLNLYQNPISKDFKDQYKQANPDRSVSFPRYVNVPLMAGINYTLPIGKDLSIYAEGLIGFNMFKISKLEGSENFYSIVTTFRPRFNPCCAFSAGAVVKDRYTIFLTYDGLTSYRPKYHTEATYSSTTMVGDLSKGDRMSVGMVSLSLGYRLFTASYHKTIVY